MNLLEHWRKCSQIRIQKEDGDTTSSNLYSNIRARAPVIIFYDLNWDNVNSRNLVTPWRAPTCHFNISKRENYCHHMTWLLNFLIKLNWRISLVLFEYYEFLAFKIGWFDFLVPTNVLYCLNLPAIPTVLTDEISCHFDNTALISIHLNQVIMNIASSTNNWITTFHAIE